MMQYRPEVDGLRALAVVPVILFHAGFTAFHGGFVGVDVFFVISGYLITSIILSELSTGTFSISRFYERRARRILPALFTVMGVCIPLAWLWLLPSDLRSFAQTLAAVPLFASNVLLWSQSGYFDGEAELKPLLHTWSLAVEEQFYVLFPLFLRLFWRRGRGLTLVALGLASILSLAAAHWGATHKPSATFFLLPTRAWELALGALAAIYMSERKYVPQRHTLNQPLSLAGLTLILYATLAYDESVPFPSLHTLVPTLGAVLIIMFATPGTWAGAVLAYKPFVTIGLLSYSAYLWHQPLFAFARHLSTGQPTPLTMAGLAAAAFALAYLTWRFVEQPFRGKALLTTRQVFGLSAASSGAFVALGMVGHWNEGFVNRLSGDKRAFAEYFENNPPAYNYFQRTDLPRYYRYECSFYDFESERTGTSTRAPVASIAPECHTRDPHFEHALLVWGDSHAQHLHFGLSQHLPSHWQLLQVASSGCNPRLGATPSRTDYCQQSNWFAYDSIKRSRPGVVLIAQESKHDFERMREMAASLRALGVKRVLFLGPVPQWTPQLPNLVLQKFWSDTPRRTFLGVKPAVLQRDRDLKQQFEHSDASAEYISLIDYFCDDTGCLVFSGNDRTTGLTTWDDGHLTSWSSERLAADVLIPLVIKAAGEPALFEADKTSLDRQAQ